MARDNFGENRFGSGFYGSGERGNDRSTKLLLHCNGIDGSVNFIDSSYNLYAVTTIGSVAIDTAQSKFGGASALFTGTGDYLSVPTSDDWNFKNNSWTIDTWVMLNVFPGTSQKLHILKIPGALDWYIKNSSGTTQIGWDLEFGGSGLSQFDSYAFTTGNWLHLVFEYTKDNLKLGYSVDGSNPKGSGGFAINLSDSASAILIGSNLNGWIDEFRVSKGVCRWFGAFSPPDREYD